MRKCLNSKTLGVYCGGYASSVRITKFKYLHSKNSVKIHFKVSLLCHTHQVISSSSIVHSYIMELLRNYAIREYTTMSFLITHFTWIIYRSCSSREKELKVLHGVFNCLWDSFNSLLMPQNHPHEQTRSSWLLKLFLRPVTGWISIYPDQISHKINYIFQCWGWTEG